VGESPEMKEKVPKWSSHCVELNRPVVTRWSRQAQGWTHCCYQTQVVRTGSDACKVAKGKPKDVLYLHTCVYIYNVMWPLRKMLGSALSTAGLGSGLCHALLQTPLQVLPPWLHHQGTSLEYCMKPCTWHSQRNTTTEQINRANNGIKNSTDSANNLVTSQMD
jgi:hypothetical protein